MAYRLAWGLWFEGKIGGYLKCNVLKDTENMTRSETGTQGFQITVKPSGRSFTASPGETILAAGIRQGIGMPFDGRQRTNYSNV